MGETISEENDIIRNGMLWAFSIAFKKAFTPIDRQIHTCISYTFRFVVSKCKTGR